MKATSTVNVSVKDRINGNGHTNGVKIGRPFAKDFAQLANLIANVEFQRTTLLKSMLDPKGRDLNEDCGYPAVIGLREYEEMYKRNGIARRVVWAFPSECWRQPPEVYETEEQRHTKFERAYEKLNVRFNLTYYMRLVDGISGIGHFGILLLGLPGEMQSPVPGVGLDDQPNGRGKSNTKLGFVRALPETSVSILRYEENRTSPRYGMPKMYGIGVPKVREGVVDPEEIADAVPVHWTRVIHVAEHRESSEVFAEPIQKDVFNYLLNIRKIMGGSAEMFWKGAFPGYSFEMDPNALAQGAVLDKESIRNEMSMFQNHLQRYFAWQGVKVNSLAPQVADPSKHFDTQIEAISIAKEIPKRILIGSEIGQLASDQDKKNWNERLLDRQTNYLTPRLIRPFVIRLMAVGVLPMVEDFKVAWPDLNAPSGEAIAAVAEKQMNAIYKWIVSGAYKAIPLNEFLTNIMKLPLSDSIAIVKAAMKSLEDPEAAKNPLVIADEREHEQQMEMQKQMGEQKVAQQRELIQEKNIAKKKAKPPSAKKPVKDKRNR